MYAVNTMRLTQGVKQLLQLTTKSSFTFDEFIAVRWNDVTSFIHPSNQAILLEVIPLSLNTRDFAEGLVVMLHLIEHEDER